MNDEPGARINCYKLEGPAFEFQLVHVWCTHAARYTRINDSHSFALVVFLMKERKKLLLAGWTRPYDTWYSHESHAFHAGDTPSLPVCNYSICGLCIIVIFSFIPAAFIIFYFTISWWLNACGKAKAVLIYACWASFCSPLYRFARAA